MRVGSVDAPWGEVNAGERDAEGVEPWDLDNIDRRYLGADGVGYFGCYIQPTPEEVFGFHELGILAN